MATLDRLLPHVSSAMVAFFKLPPSAQISMSRGPGLGAGVKFRAMWKADGGSGYAESYYSMSDLLSFIASGGGVKIDFDGAHHTIVLSGKGALGSLTVAAAKRQLDSTH